MSHLKGRNMIIKEHMVDRNKEIRDIKVKKVRSNINNDKKSGK